MSAKSAALGLIAAAITVVAQDSHGFGLVPPTGLPDIPVTRHDGVRTTLNATLKGHRTALQFVFTDCSTVCPLLGNLFRTLDTRLNVGGTQLVTITVDPQRDTPARLSSWLHSFSASPRWIALHAEPRHLARLLPRFALKPGPRQAHTQQIFLIDERARYIGRTTQMPSASEIAARLNSGELSAGPIDFIATVGPDPISPREARCANCHGELLKAPPLTRSSLAAPVARRGGPPSTYTEASFCTSLRSGVDPAGVVFSKIMPRYKIGTAECGALWHQFMSLR